MAKIKDRILLGTVCGLIASYPGRALPRAAFMQRLSGRRYAPFAASLFLPRSKVHTREAGLLGWLVNNIGVSVVGTAITYVLSATGRDNAVLKGMGVTALSWAVVEGIIGAQVMGQTPKKPTAPIVSLTAHLLSGAICGAMVAWMGDDRLFPAKNPSAARIPLVAMGRDGE